MQTKCQWISAVKSKIMQINASERFQIFIKCLEVYLMTLPKDCIFISIAKRIAYLTL